MKIALLTLVGDTADALGDHVSFHLAAGADVVLVGGLGGAERPELPGGGRARYVEAATHTGLARVAVAEHGADWVIPSAANEFWWPRGESLGDVLAVMPVRYGLVQALVRTFAGTRAAGDFAERMTMRTSLLGPQGRGDAALEDLLRPAYRAEPEMVVDGNDWTLRGLRVPLRAWYPLEVLRFPAAPVAPTDGAEPPLVEDTRLRDALRSLRESGEIVFPIPNVVDDASYAVECAAVGEVDLEAFDRQIRELELRIAALEARFWPTVRRGLRRLARRPS